MPRVSVIVPTHERPGFVAEALDSIRAQTRPADELIVVDDGSSEAVSRSVAALGEDFRYVRQENAGLAAARNTGVRHASGDLLAFLDDDDLWLPHHLETCLAHLDGNHAIVLSQMQVLLTGRPGGPQLDEVRTFPAFQAAVVPRAVWERLGPIDESLSFGEDVDWFVRALDVGVPVRRTERVTVHYRRHASNMTNDRDAAAEVFPQLVRRSLQRRRAATGGDAGPAPRSKRLL